MAQAQLTQYNQVLGFLREQLPRLSPTALATTARNIVIDLQNGNIGSIAQHIADATGHEITPETRESVQRVANNVREFAQELRNNVQRDALDQRAAALERTNAMTVLLEANGVPGAYVRGGMIYTADNRPIGTVQEVQDAYNRGALGDTLREHGIENDFPNNLEDLIQENDSQGTSEMSANGNGRGPPPREPPTDGEAEAQRAAASSGSSFGNPISKETQISRPPTITYGLQETHTTVRIPSVYSALYSSLTFFRTDLPIYRLVQCYQSNICIAICRRTTNDKSSGRTGIAKLQCSTGNRHSMASRCQPSSIRQQQHTIQHWNNLPNHYSIWSSRYRTSWMVQLLATNLRILHSHQLRIRNRHPQSEQQQRQCHAHGNGF